MCRFPLEGCVGDRRFQTLVSVKPWDQGPHLAALRRPQYVPLLAKGSGELALNAVTEGLTVVLCIR